MNLDELKFFNPWAEIHQTQNRLPHWQQSGAIYFVTWHLGDSLPNNVLDRYFDERKWWLGKHPKPWSEDLEEEYHRLFSSCIDQWLDAGHGACLLRKTKNAEMVREVLEFFEEKRTAMVSFVIMPNHAHVLFALHPEWELGQVLQSWKRHSSREINQLEGTEGSLWQKDYFDRLVRNREHFSNCVRYIRNNPGKAGLKSGDYLLYENELAQEII